MARKQVENHSANPNPSFYLRLHEEKGFIQGHELGVEWSQNLLQILFSTTWIPLTASN